MADLGIIFLRRKHTIHSYQSLFTIITFFFWGGGTLYVLQTPIILGLTAIQGGPKKKRTANVAQIWPN